MYRYGVGPVTATCVPVLVAEKRSRVIKSPETSSSTQPMPLTRQRLRHQSRLLELPFELQLQIAASVGDPRDRAKLCLACPPLGLAAIRQFAEYRSLLFAVAMRLASVPGACIDEALLRRFAKDTHASAAGCERLAEWAADAGTPMRLECCRYSLPNAVSHWRLINGDNEGAVVLLLNVGNEVLHYEGERDSERMLLGISPDGKVGHFEGERGSEKRVRIVFPDGGVQHFDGERGFERLVRAVFPNGAVLHFDGERGSERMVRAVLADGIMKDFEGSCGSERKVRVLYPHCAVQHFEGEHGAERLVRATFPNGAVLYYEGECGAERIVRGDLPCGMVAHYKGERGAEHIDTYGGNGG